MDYTRPGTAPYAWGDKIEARTVQVNVACLDDVDFKEVMKSGIQYMNGRDNDWFNIPAFTEHI